MRGSQKAKVSKKYRWSICLTMVGLLVVGSIWTFFFLNTNVWAQDMTQDQELVQMIPSEGHGQDSISNSTQTTEDPSLQSYTQKFLGDMQLDELQSLLDEILGGKSFDLMDALAKIISGQQPFTKEVFLDVVYQAVFGEVERQKVILFQIVLLILAQALFANFSKAFEKGMVQEVCFYVVYMILFTILVKSFGELSLRLGEQLATIVTLMKGVAPAYYLAIAASSGISSATVFYQVILLLILGIQTLLANFVLPCVNLYVLLELVNYLSREDILSRLAELLRTLVEWSLRTMLGVLVGMQMIQGLVAPVIDTLKRSALGKTASAIPGVGNAINSVTEIILTSAVLIRNSLGVVFLVAFILWGVTPLVRYGVNALLYKFLAAIVQPISDRRIVGCLSIMGEGCVLLLKTLFTVQVLCMITIVVIAGTF